MVANRVLTRYPLQIDDLLASDYLLPIVKNTKKIRWVTRTFEILLNAASIVAGLDESWLVPLRLKITYL